MDDFRCWLLEQDRSARTVKGYLTDLRIFAKWFEQMNGQDLQVEAVTPTDVREYRDWLLQQRNAATVKRHLMAVRAYCRWGIETGRIERNPAARIKLPQEEKLSPGWLTKQEQYRLLRSAERQIGAANTPNRRRQAIRNHALLVFLMNTGLRIGEVCAMKIEDVQISERAGWVLVRGKGNKNRRVPLNLAARQAIKTWLEERGRGAEEGLFGMSERRIQSVLSELGRRSGVSVHPHRLRHTFAKNLVDAGVGLHEVAAVMGHSNLNTTRIYTMPGEHDLLRAVSALEE